ncbi:MAG: polyprenyl synthetase family protein [Prevotellaceae bacterium]|nr:polyprenyl synthetase family protein [Prevotellaceae bacterium]
MDYLSTIKQPIEAELTGFIELFNSSLSHEDGMLGSALEHIRKRAGKRMRPMLILLMAKNFGQVTEVTQHAAVGLELLHTASLVHDDVVDESRERRGQASVNATYDNKVAVLVGDYILSTALLHVAHTGSQQIVAYLAELGRTLSNGEILQLTNIGRKDISEDVYYDVIKQKTAALFEACCAMGALSAGASDDAIAKAKKFGQNLGVIFQIRDDIFDYYDSPQIGKPTGNDMAEGKLTLPVIYALNSTRDEAMTALAFKVKDHAATQDEIARLVAFAKEKGGIDYAERRMEELHAEAVALLDSISKDDSPEKQDVKRALLAYLDFVIKREK